MRSALTSLISVRVAGLVAAIAALGSCTVVVPEGGMDAGTKIIVIPIRPDAGPPPPPPLTASVLYVANLQRSSANLGDAYSRIILGVAAFLQSKGLILENMGLISTYADQFGPRLLLGRRVGAPSSSVSLLAALGAAHDAGVTDPALLLPYISAALTNVTDEDLPRALSVLASSGSFDGATETAEARAVIDFGRNINTISLPPELGGIDRSALFDKPRDLFLVVYLQPLPRHCALGSAACQVNGRDPAQIFEQTNSDGTATWLAFSGQGIRPEKIVQVAIATSEGEDLTAFRTRCKKVSGFPENLFDVIAPSPNLYFGPLMSALNGAHGGTGQTGDFCDLVGDSEAIAALGRRIATLAVVGH